MLETAEQKEARLLTQREQSRERRQAEMAEERAGKSQAVYAHMLTNATSLNVYV